MNGCEILIEQASDLSTRIYVDGAELKHIIGYSITEHHVVRMPVALSVTQHANEPFPVERTTLYPIHRLTIIANQE